MSTGICIVWPAYFEGSTDPQAHVTALFLGNTDTAEFSKDRVLRAIEPVCRWGSWGDFTVKGTDMFGAEKDKPVILLQDGGLSGAVKELTQRLVAEGIVPSNLFPFVPHVTVSEGSVIPLKVHLSRPVLWWGDQRAIHPKHALREKAVDMAIAAVKEEHGEWYAHLAECYRPVVVSAVNAALKVA